MTVVIQCSIFELYPKRLREELLDVYRGSYHGSVEKGIIPRSFSGEYSVLYSIFKGKITD